MKFAVMLHVLVEWTEIEILMKNAQLVRQRIVQMPQQKGPPLGDISYKVLVNIVFLRIKRFYEFSTKHENETNLRVHDFGKSLALKGFSSCIEMYEVENWTKTKFHLELKYCIEAISSITNLCEVFIKTVPC